MFPTDTIAAVATPIGEGGIAVIRVSGPESLAIVQRCFESSNGRMLNEIPTHSVLHGEIRQDGRCLDEVLATVFRAPRSYTCEDTVEIGCHGGMIVTRLVLEAVLASGARLAMPGEFTQRAFLNGRLDLAQAEAVNDLIHARSELAASAAAAQLRGSLSVRIEAIRDVLMHVLAHVEAHIDFPDEDIAPETGARLLERLDSGSAELDALLATAWEGRVLRQGLKLAIIGRPNAGKSSLLNRLLGFERAIVTPMAGTTRDTIEESANIRGIPIVLVDTAGLRESADTIELEGMRRSRLAAEDADLVIHVLDGGLPLEQADVTLLEEGVGSDRRLIVVNKMDLQRQLVLPGASVGNALWISCETGEGLDELKAQIEKVVWSGAVVGKRLDVAVNVRQQDALRRARLAVNEARLALAGELGLEVVALELRVATGAVGEVVGKTGTEDLLDQIFSTFCLGK